MELQCNMALRWFVGLNLDQDAWDASTFSQNRRRRFDESGLLERLFDEGEVKLSLNTVRRYDRASEPERLQREMAALYKREGTSMFAGFGPLLLQWPFLSVMYLLFRSPTVGGTANTLLTHDLFGVPLGAHWLSGAGPLGLASAQGVVFVGLFALLAGLCWLSARLGRLMTAQATGISPAPGAAGRPGLLVRALPYLTVVIAAFAPLAAGIYLLTTLAWSLAERMLYSRPKGWTALSTDRGSRSRRFPPERPSWTQSGPRRRRTASVE